MDLPREPTFTGKAPEKTFCFCKVAPRMATRGIVTVRVLGCSHHVVAVGMDCLA